MEGDRTFPGRLTRIQELKRDGKYGEAEKEIQKELQLAPGDLLLKTSLADLYLRQDRPAEARILAEEVLARDPRHPQALSILGDFFLAEKSFREALEYFRQASLRDPRPYLHFKIARALKELGKLPEALEELENVLVVKRDHLPFLKEKALTLNRMKRFDEALACYERIQTIRPDDPFVQKEILRLRSRTRPKDQVLKELTAVMGMESKKDNPQMHGLLAQKLKDSGMVREAAAEYKAAADLEPGNSFFLKQEGFCHYRLKEYPEAIRCLTQAFRKDPSDFVVRKTLEKIQAAQGDLPGFLELLEEVLRHHPQNKTLLGPIKRIRKKLSPSSSGVS